jgi:signal transduction histidine kinase
MMGTIEPKYTQHIKFIKQTMNIVANTSLRRNLQIIEWVQHGAIIVIWLISFNPHYYGNQPGQIALKIVLWCITLTMSCLVPYAGSHRLRRLYVVCNIGVLISGCFAGVGDTMLIYIALAKSCFLLSLQEVVAVAVITGLLLSFSIFTSFSNYVKFALEHLNENVLRFKQPQGQSEIMWSNVIINTSTYIVASTFVISFAAIITREQQSRHRAEQLAIEVETLAATLERDRIAREIHDSLGHSLMALQVQLELSECLHLSEPSQATKSLRIANQLALQCIKDVRRSVQGIRAIGHFDLQQSLQTLLQQTVEHQNLIVHQQLYLPDRLPTQTSQQLYCIIQEGLTNICKHAHAQEINISSDYDQQHLWLELQDNGQGFMERVDRHHGFGLRGMRERVHLIGGRLEIQSSIGQGTKIQVVIPYDSLITSG